MFEKWILVAGQGGSAALRGHENPDLRLNDTAWAWVALYHRQHDAADGRVPPDLRAVLNAIFYLLRTGCQWRLLPPASFRARAPSTTTSEPGRMGASWLNCNGRCISRR